MQLPISNAEQCDRAVLCARCGLRRKSKLSTLQYLLRNSIPACAIVALLQGWMTVPVAGQDCIDYADYLHFVGSVQTPDQVNGVAIDGAHAFVAGNHSGLQVVSISEPATPEIVGSIDTPGEAMDVAISGLHAFVADGSAALQVVDISDPAYPVIVATVAMPGQASDVEIEGTYAYLAVAPYPYFSRLYVVDISTPGSPVIAGSIDLGDIIVNDLAVTGSYAYLATGWCNDTPPYCSGGLMTIDISNPTFPEIVSHWGGDVVLGVAVIVPYVYLTTTRNSGGVSSSFLVVVDVSNPMSPAIVGSAGRNQAAEYSSSVAVSGPHAYVTNAPGWFGHSILEVFDIANPATPARVGSIITRSAGDVVVAGVHAYIADASSLRVADITNPSSPGLVGRVANSGLGWAVAVAGIHAYVAGSSFDVVDISDPHSPSVVGSVYAPGGSDLAVSDTHAYVTRAQGLTVVDILDPANPEISGFIYTNDALGVAVDGSYAFIAAGLYGLAVVDVLDPKSPSLVSRVDMRFANDVAVDGGRAYVTNGDLGLSVVDISNPKNPVVLGTVDTPGQTRGVAVAVSHAYVAADSGLQVIDISDSAHPMLVGNVETRGRAVGVAVTGTDVYLTDKGLQVVDISNPTSPAIVGSVGFGHCLAGGVAVAGTYVYVCDDGSDRWSPPVDELVILPVQCSVPAAVEISSFEARGSHEGILLSWITSWEGDHLGFHVHRSTIAQGDDARVTAELIQPPGPYSVLDSGITPGTTYFYRLEAVDRSGASEFYGPVEATALAAAPSQSFLSQNHPNPFVAGRGATAIEFNLGQSGPAKLRVFDATGRLVHVLVDQPLDAGPHSVAWDGRNEGGSEAASGIYYYRLDAGEFSKVRALVKVK